ncbi:hypothetical protein X797_003915 [Metarhizium robertsii]|uniref:Intracellular protein transport-like protein n=2 Tax=Metarhizium robertsii TaxID=568076 RepID=E9EVQ1_METRA|nr:intracellular protein transport-like protein [Metarhizium robertsii ARSEF 23]EFZ00323.1 intracellular protein transport-like protein [Metarhizium robertsii ARSEF 23]EXV02793.1 hypothetical protein X797_003915 [Metarhizium robertsii]
MAQLASLHGHALADLEPGPSSIVSTSDTTSASKSSDTLRHDELFFFSSHHHQQQPPPQPQEQQDDSLDKICHQTPSDLDTPPSPCLPIGHSVTSSLSSLTSIATPVAGTTFQSTIAHFPPPPLRTPIRRKPLSSSASSLAASLSLRDSVIAAVPAPLNPDLLPRPGQRFARPPSVDSPTFYDYPQSIRTSVPSSSSPVTILASAQAGASEAHSIPADELRHRDSSDSSGVLSVYDELTSQGSNSSSPDEDNACSSTPGNAIDDHSLDEIESLYGDHADHTLSPLMLAPKPTPPHLKLDTVESSASQSQLESRRQSGSPESAKLAASPHLNKPLPRSPGQGSPFASLFGWSNPSPSVTDFSSIPSPLSPGKSVNASHETSRNAGSNSSSSNSNGATSNPISYCESYLSTPPPGTTASSLEIDEMEDELKAISSELAASIRREMDLEDLVDRLQEQANNPQAPSKRSSDYFSDSGYSSAKLSEYDQSREEIEKIQRRSEQEKATIRLELSNKLQDERTKRKALDQQIKDLSEKASQMDLAHMNNLDANDRVKDLEKACEDLRRRLAEERESKNNFEDLLSGLKSELQDTCNERDNLRDEVVPQLRARVEGLEAEAASYANLTYESTKMQHQLQSLKQENTSLRNSLGPDDIALARSNSVATSSFKARGPPALGGLARSESVKQPHSESREALAERLKDVEAQRDALHNALKNLLERQEFQNRENAKKIKILEAERQRLLLEPRKAGFDKEISSLRTEINVLRRRAEDALEQKWQVEKGLGGLKMDLDRAEEEIASLRSLLEEKDILIPPSLARSSAPNGTPNVPVTSESLQKAYQDLRSSYSESLERIKKLELSTGDALSDEKTKLAIERLEQSLSAAVSERDAARRHLDGLMNQVESLSNRESRNLDREKALSDELGESAMRVEQLASQVQQQLATNAELRKRLADTVARGDSDRKLNSERITELQARLHALEEQLVTAQTASEERVSRHEEELSQLREAHNEQLGRIHGGAGVGVTARKGSLLKSGVASIFGRSGQAITPKSFEEEVEIKTLRARVAELEKALADAESEIQQVVSKMNEAQIQVMDLQEERETAARETRKLQIILEEAKLTPLSGRA